MKMLPLNVDFSGVNLDALDSSRPVHASVKKGFPLKNGYFSAIRWSSVKTVADRHKHAAYHNKHWQWPS